MPNKCGRCSEKEAEVECVDCGGRNSKGPVPLCLECSDLLHVGFMKGHDIETLEVKEKRAAFKEELATYRKREQALIRRLVEVKHASQNISSRLENNEYSMQQATVAISQALKEKEGELLGCMKQGASSTKAQLGKCEETLQKRIDTIKKCHEKADSLLKAEATKFMSEHSKIAEEIEALLNDEITQTLPALNSAISLEVNDIVQSIQAIGRQWLANQKKEETPCPSTNLKDIKEGDKFHGYIESRMDAKGCFWICQDLQEGITNCLDDLSFEIRKDIITNGWEDLTVKEGSLCVAQYQQDHRWYRAKVEKLKEHTAEVRWLDYAHGSEVQLTHLQPLREKFLNIPYQGLECCLAEDISEEMPRQARWEFSDLTSDLLLECTILKKLEIDDRGGIPIFVVKLVQPGDEKVDITQNVLNKAEECKSKQGPIAYRDVRLLNEKSKEIQVTKVVLNASKTPEKASDDARKEEKPTSEETTLEPANGDGNTAEDKTDEEDKSAPDLKEDGDDDAAPKPNGEDVEVASEAIDAEDGGDVAASGEGGEGQEDLDLAQKLEKQGDTAPSVSESVPVTTRHSPMAFIAAHGSYYAINGVGGGGGSGVMPQYGAQHPHQDMASYPYFASHFALPNVGQTSRGHGDQLAPGMPVMPGDYMEIVVVTPLKVDGTFWAARGRGHEAELRFRRLMQEISLPSIQLSLEQLHRGKRICAYSQEMGHWCRAEVEEISHDGIHVRCLDFGNVAVVDASHTKSLDARHEHFPFQALECNITKETLAQFSESSRHLFHDLTNGQKVNAKVDAVVGRVKYVSLVLPGRDGETIDVVAELAKNEESTKVNGSVSGGVKEERGGRAPGEYPHSGNYQSRQVPRAGFTSFAKEMYRKSPAFVADVERDLSLLVSSVHESQQPSQMHSFPPMPRDQRAFVHELAEIYQLSSDSKGQETARHVIVTAHRGKSFVPSPTLSEVAQSEARIPSVMDDPQGDYRQMGGNMDAMKCYICGEMGHMRSKCPKGKSRNKSSWWGGDGGRQWKGRKGGRRN